MIGPLPFFKLEPDRTHKRTTMSRSMWREGIQWLGKSDDLSLIGELNDDFADRERWLVGVVVVNALGSHVVWEKAVEAVRPTMATPMCLSTLKIFFWCDESLKLTLLTHARTMTTSPSLPPLMASTTKTFPSLTSCLGSTRKERTY